MPKQRCSACGHEDWTEKLWFCPADEMWLCTRCASYLGVVDTTPTCPRCHRSLTQLHYAAISHLIRNAATS
ncbi:MAG: hypothetical protein HY825_15750 [Acidobacteria bacterium]|nr:hypothetical protein [Acidobacteriota bacterium]